MAEQLKLASEMVASCSFRLGAGEHETAVKGIRAICQYYGGQMIFLPKFKKDNSETAEQIRGVLADAVGDPAAETMLDVLMSQFGGVSLYIPQESRAFRDEMAKEIKERYDGTQETMRDLCRDYKISFAQVYRLWHRAEQIEREEREKNEPTLFDDI